MTNQPGNLALGVAKPPRINPTGDWADHAACRGIDPDLFFAEDRTGSYREARAVCRTCPVRRPCLDWALETHTDHGLWGGLNPLQRQQLRRRRNEP